MTGTRSRQYHSRSHCVGTGSPGSKRAKSAALPSSPSRSKGKKAAQTSGSPRKRKFEDDGSNDEDLGLKVVNIKALPGEESPKKMSRQVRNKDNTRLEIEETHAPQEMDPFVLMPMQDAYDLGPIMSPCDSISIDTPVPDTLGYFDWDDLLREESPDALDLIGDKSINELIASDDDLDPLAESEKVPTRQQRYEQITTVYLAKATLDKVISDAQTGCMERMKALEDLQRVSDMLGEIRDGFEQDLMNFDEN